MGGDGTFAELINTMVLRRQREANIDVNNSEVAVKPTDIKLGLLPSGV